MADLVASIPIEIILDRLRFHHIGANQNLVKLAKIPRLLRMIRFVKLVKIFNNARDIQRTFSRFRIPMKTKQIIKSLSMMYYVLHLYGCIFAATAHISEAYKLESWIDTNNL